jgi:hypothetical protein
MGCHMPSDRGRASTSQADLPPLHALPITMAGEWSTHSTFSKVPCHMHPQSALVFTRGISGITLYKISVRVTVCLGILDFDSEFLWLCNPVWICWGYRLGLSSIVLAKDRNKMSWHEEGKKHGYPIWGYIRRGWFLGIGGGFSALGVFYEPIVL